MSSIASKVRFAPSIKTDFFPTLKKRVDHYFTENNKSRYADKRMVIKTVALLSIYCIPFVLLLVFSPPVFYSFVLWFLMGIGMSGIGMSVMHDALHGAYSSNPRINRMLGFTLNLLGADITNWKLQHNVMHHTYTNIVPLDEDIRDRGVVKLSPHAHPTRLHQLQWIYAFLFYGVLTLYWVTVKDFIQYAGFIKTGVNRQTTAENKKLLLRVLTLKALYFIILIGLPLLIMQRPALEIIGGFLFMHFVSGLILTVVFQLAHTVEGTTHPTVSAQGTIDRDWATHQLETTVNFSPGNKWLSWYVGGLNFQIEHHLFPKICHIHYPAIAPIVQQTALEYGIAYQQNHRFRDALSSHIRLLRTFGKLPDPNDAIG